MPEVGVMSDKVFERSLSGLTASFVVDYSGDYFQNYRLGDG